MLNIVNWSMLFAANKMSLLSRPKQINTVKEQVTTIINGVKERGDEGLHKCCQAFDKYALNSLRESYDYFQLQRMRALTNIPLIASGGAGRIHDFVEIFSKTAVDGALAAGIFHEQITSIAAVKQHLLLNTIEVRPL